MGNCNQHPSATSGEERVKLPKVVFFLMILETFRSYGSGAHRSFTFLMVDLCHYSQDQATRFYHASGFIALFSPIFAAILSDNWIGKYWTARIGSFLSTIGFLIITLMTIPYVNKKRLLFWIGIVIRSLGYGFLNPSFTPLIIDQFTLPDHEKYFFHYFYWNYVVLNFFTFMGIVCTAIFRANIHCFQQYHCYFLAFLIPTILLFLMVLGLCNIKHKVRRLQPQGNVITTSIQCICYALSRKIISCLKRIHTEVPHWLNLSDQKYGRDFVHDLRCVLDMMFVLLPTPMIWCLYMMFESRWVFQATRMDLTMFGLHIEPEQIINVNIIGCVILAPLCEYVIYPRLVKYKLSKPLPCIFVGGLIIALAFTLSGILELVMEQQYPTPLKRFRGHLRIFNGVPCRYNFSGVYIGMVRIDGLKQYKKENIFIKGSKTFDVQAIPSKDCENASEVNFTMQVKEKTALSYLFSGDTNVISFEDVVEYSNNGHPHIRLLSNNLNGTLTIKGLKYTVFEGSLASNALHTIAPGRYAIYVDNKQVRSNFRFQRGAYYTIVAVKHYDAFKIKINTCRPPNSIHVLYQLPQMCVLVIGQILYSVTIMEFVYGESPASMRSFMWAYISFMNALGQCITIVFAVHKYKMSTEFFAYSIALFLCCIVFRCLASRYKYRNSLWAS